MLWGIIYKATNLLNGKVYIGQTRRSLKDRMKQHLHASKSQRKRKYAFQHAIRKYGESAFRWEVIDTAYSDIELNEKEKYWIRHYKSYLSPTHGYNQTPGGKHFPEEELPILQYDLKGNLIKEYNSICEVSEEIGGDMNGIRKCCLNHCTLYMGHIYLYKSFYESKMDLEKEITERIIKINTNTYQCVFLV